MLAADRLTSSPLPAFLPASTLPTASSAVAPCLASLLLLRGLLLQDLLALGADVLARDRSGASPLFRACEAGHLGMVACLLRAGADVTQVRRRGEGKGVVVGVLLCGCECWGEGLLLLLCFVAVLSGSWEGWSCPTSSLELRSKSAVNLALCCLLRIAYPDPRVFTVLSTLSTRATKLAPDLPDISLLVVPAAAQLLWGGSPLHLCAAWAWRGSGAAAGALPGGWSVLGGGCSVNGFCCACWRVGGALPGPCWSGF